jgi:TRAP-type C4-dicarboxylate transport system permease small subunit
MRRLLDRLYDAAAWLAALCLAALLGMVLLSIASRQLHFHVPGTDAYAGYLMAACGFLALAHTLVRGEHIRVTLVLNALPPRLARPVQIWAWTAGVLLALLFAYYSARLAWQSYAFKDVSTASDATPLWIPQLAMALGTIVLAIAFVDQWWIELKGREPQQNMGEALRNE